MLVRGFEAQPELVKRLLDLAPTARTCSDLGEVRQASWDILVTDRPLTGAETHLCAVYVCPKLVQEQKKVVEDRIAWPMAIAVAGGHICQEWKRVKALPERIAVLTHEQLEPVLKARSSHVRFGATRDVSVVTMRMGSAPTPTLEPFIVTADDYVLAGRYMRSDTSEAWLLPHDVPDLVPWVRAALAEWHTLAPDRFPGIPDWSEGDAWLTAGERGLRARLSALLEERAALLEESAEREASLRGELRDARELADHYERALLTTQSDDLKAAVMRALREIGFKVTDADLEAAPDDHLEDLRVEDTDAPGWVALVEVKGYTKGAKTEALTQFLRFNARYRQRTGTEPDAMWYVANQFLGRDPATRSKVLNGKDEDVAAFASAGGLIVDTVALFRALCAVGDNQLPAESVRRMLRESRGRFMFPQPGL